MKSQVLVVSKGSEIELSKIDSSISLVPFFEILESKTLSTSSQKKREYFESVLAQYPYEDGKYSAVRIEDIKQYEPLIEEIYNIITPPIFEESKVFKAFSVPMKPIIFYGTNAFFELLTKGQNKEVEKEIVDQHESSKQIQLSQLYSFILERLYGYAKMKTRNMTLAIKDAKTSRKQYYSLEIDNTFVQVRSKGALPELNIEQLKKIWQGTLSLELIAELIPLNQFRFEGFSIITLIDITEERTIERFKSLILNKSAYSLENYHSEIQENLRVLCGNPELHFDIIPRLIVNNEMVLNPDSGVSSLFNACVRNENSRGGYEVTCNAYIQNPSLILKSNLGEDEHKEEFDQALLDEGIRSFAVLPVMRSQQLLGAIMVYGHVNNQVNESVLRKLEAVLPNIEQILQHEIDEFEAKMDKVIQEKFTFLQPAVEWKFREAAFSYLENKNGKRAGKISFKDVYPIYGAIDIRNSTIERNEALARDLEVQFIELIKTLKLLIGEKGLGLVEDLIFQSEKILQRIQDNPGGLEGLSIQHFLDEEIQPLFLHFKQLEESENIDEEPQTELYLSLMNYFALIDEKKGLGFENRRELERSMQLINKSINTYLDRVSLEMQNVFPMYFERFRTDGIEYDIYIGQSIEPRKRFNKVYLQNIRRWQLSSMAGIAIMNQALLKEMKQPLNTTQLIFVNPGTIDITFREDERRFDVEGAYNIRYEVIKKRIDKVNILGTDERLTQPQKIAIVYFDDETVKEYINYIRNFQEQGLLLDDLEFLNLEPLQGVSNLKALRVGINLDYRLDQE